MIDRGSIVVRGGRIVSVAAGAPTAGGGQAIDAKGMTALPGFIDAHRHIMTGNDERWFKEQSVPRMHEFLDAGYTTLMSGGGPVPGIIELKRRVDTGALKGPRVITSGRVDPDNFKTDVFRAGHHQADGTEHRSIHREESKTLERWKAESWISYSSTATRLVDLRGS